MPRMLPLLTFLTTLTLGGCSRDSAELPLRTPEGNPPNLLIVSIDTLRADHLGAWGYDQPTSPMIDELAATGVRFERALSPASETAPGTASLLTGRYADRHGAWHNVVPLSPEATTIAELASRAGYRTGALVGNRLLAARFGFAQGFDSFHGFWTENAEEASDEVGVSRAIEWIEGRETDAADAGRPWFLWLHLMDPHGPFTSAGPDWSKDFEYPDGRFGEDAAVRLAIGNYGLGVIPRYQQIDDHDRLSYYVRRYDGEIRYTDHHLGRLMRALRERRLHRRTLVVLSADHGESLTGHREYLQHGWFIYDSTVRAPLLFALPGSLPEGAVVREPVGTIDVVPTLVELLGLEASPQAFDGRSLAVALAGGRIDAERSLFGFGARANYPFSVSRGRWKLIHTTAGTPRDARLSVPPGGFQSAESVELYDIVNDPGELDNLADEAPKRTDEMLAELSAFEIRVKASIPDVGRALSR